MSKRRNSSVKGSDDIDNDDKEENNKYVSRFWNLLLLDSNLLQSEGSDLGRELKAVTSSRKINSNYITNKKKTTKQRRKHWRQQQQRNPRNKPTSFNQHAQLIVHTTWNKIESRVTSGLIQPPKKAKIMKTQKSWTAKTKMLIMIVIVIMVIVLVRMAITTCMTSYNYKQEKTTVVTREVMLVITMMMAPSIWMAKRELTIIM